MIRRLGFLAGLALAVSSRGAVAQHPLMTIPIDDPAYEQLEGLMHRGCPPALVSPYRPFMVSQIQKALVAAQSVDRCKGAILDELVHRFMPADSAADSAISKVGVRGGLEATLRFTALEKGDFRPMWHDVLPTDSGTPPVNGLLRGRVVFSGGKQIVIVAQAYGETNVRNDPTVRAKNFRSTSGVIDFDEAYFNGRLGPFYLDFGRQRDAWTGEGTESLVFSAHGPPIDRVLFSAIWDKWEFRGLFGSLNDVTLDPAIDSLQNLTSPQEYHRMFIAHGLTFRPSPKVELTIGETGVIPRQGGGVNLAFANPFMIYQVTQNDQSQGETATDANLTAYGSFRFVLGAATIQAEILIDDIQIDSKDRAKFPDQLGWNFKGTYALPLMNGASVGVQYRRISSFTYVEPFYTKAFQNYNQVVGSELGPDADMATGMFEIWPQGKLKLGASLSRWRHGAYRIDQRPGPNREGHKNDPYPDVTPERPAVQGTWLGDLSATWAHQVFPVTLDVELANIENVNNQPSPAATYAIVRLQGSYRFRYP